MGPVVQRDFSPLTDAPALLRLRAELSAAGDPARAAGQQAYMKSAMPYHGVATPDSRRIFARLFKPITWPDAAAWETDVRAIWDGALYREERYAAIALTGIRQARPFQTPDALPLYEHMIVTGAWWDYVDDIATQRLRELLRTHPTPIAEAMRQWAHADDLWKRRSAILCQVGLKGETDMALLHDCIEPAMASKEFFLRKAIGWALREVAWHAPQEVVRYVTTHRDRLSPLSKREALKNVLKSGLIWDIP